MACKTMRLKEFAHEYEKASKNMRMEELEEDFHCKQGTPSQIVKNCGITCIICLYTYNIQKI